VFARLVNLDFGRPAGGTVLHHPDSFEHASITLIARVRRVFSGLAAALPFVAVWPQFYMHGFLLSAVRRAFRQMVTFWLWHLLRVDRLPRLLAWRLGWNKQRSHVLNARPSTEWAFTSHHARTRNMNKHQNSEYTITCPPTANQHGSQPSTNAISYPLSLSLCCFLTFAS
jgi:hypothetical protein